jgi:hypothetical protein
MEDKELSKKIVEEAIQNVEDRKRIEALNKYEWVFNQFLRSGEYRGGNLGELQEINSHHLALFGREQDLSCNQCRGEMMRNVGEWYFKTKNKLINE